MMNNTLLRTITLSIVCLFTAVAIGSAQTPKKTQPTDASVIDMIGARLVKVFQKFNTPEDVFFSRSDNPDNDGVVLDYGKYGFKVREKTVRICFFWAEWTGSVKGVKIGDDRSKVTKVLGSEYRTEINKDGVEDYGYELKDNDAYMWVVFNKEDKVKRIQIELK